MTPTERSMKSIYDFMDIKINQLKCIKYKNICEDFEKSGTTTSDKLQIRKLRLKK